jgi:mercuric ion transport protein
VTAAFLGSLCCIGPPIFVALGLGAGLASTFEPLRPLFGTLMAAMLGLGFYVVYRPHRAASGGPRESVQKPMAGQSCALPGTTTRDKAIVWTAAVLAVILWTFPTWSKLFL